MEVSRTNLPVLLLQLNADVKDMCGQTPASVHLPFKQKFCEAVLPPRKKLLGTQHMEEEFLTAESV